MNYNILQFVYGIGQTYPTFGSIFVFISGPLSFIVVPATILIILSVRAKENFMHTFSLIFLAGFFSFLSARILKEIFRIARPYVTHPNIIALAHAPGFSFPSEHASVYGALTMILFHFDYRLGVASLIFAILVMFSRVIIGVHYPIDVIVGFAVGAFIAYGIILFFDKFL